MENWYVIAIPTIDLPPASVLDPGYGFALVLLVDYEVLDGKTLSVPNETGLVDLIRTGFVRM